VPFIGCFQQHFRKTHKNMTQQQSNLDYQLPIEQLVLLRKQSAAAFTATIAILFYLIFKIHNLVEPTALTLWAGGVIALNIYLLIWLYLVRQASNKDSFNCQKAKFFIKIYQVQAILHGATWGCLPFLLIDLTSPEVRFFAYIVLCGMAAGAIGTTAMIYRIYLSFMLPMMLPVIFTKLFFNNDYFQFSQNTLEMLIIFVVSLAVLAHTHYEHIKRSIELRAENKNLLNDVTDALKKEEAANKAKSNFLANMSHELRTPLNTIIGYSEMIHDDVCAKNLKEVIEDTNKITTAGKHLLSLINDVLDLSKIEAGKMEVSVEEINIYHFLTEIKESLEALIEQNKNTFIFDISNDLTTIQSDSTKLRQILYNIIGNAAKFTSHGQVVVKTTNTEKNLIILISDTGIGMTKEQLADLASRFTQADISTTRKYGGTGLGMNLTKHLTDLLKIQLTVKSIPDKGTSFELFIPLDYQAA